MKQELYCYYKLTRYMSALWSGFYFHGLHIPDKLNLSKFETQMIFIFPLYFEKHCNRHLASSFSQIFLKVNFQKKDTGSNYTNIFPNSFLKDMYLIFFLKASIYWLGTYCFVFPCRKGQTIWFSNL